MMHHVKSQLKFHTAYHPNPHHNFNFGAL